MNLEALTFKVETDELKNAVTEIEKLAGAVKALAGPVENLKKASTKVSQSVESTGTSAEQTGKKIKKIKEAVEDTVDPLEKLKANLKLTQRDLADGFTRGESNILKVARSLGATDDQLKEVKSILQEIGKLFKDPFDSAIGSVRSITKEFDALGSRATLAQQGITLTTKQLREYSRIKDEVEAKMSAGGFENGSPETIARIQREQAEYIKLALDVNRLTAEEKERQRLGKEMERQQLENLKMGDQMVAMFRKQEEAKQDAIRDTNALLDKMNRKTTLLQQGYSSGEASTFVNLQDRGLSTEQIESYIRAQREAIAVEKQRQKSLEEYERQQLENLKMGDDAVARFRKQEDAKQNALLETKALMENIARKTVLIQQGYSSGEANTFINLQDRGVGTEQINKYIQVQRQANDLEREASRLQSASNKQAREKAQAVKYLSDLEERLNMQMEEHNQKIAPAYVNQLAKLQRMIRLSGMEAEQASSLYAKLDAQIRSVSSKQNEAQMRNLARAMSVQMGDVGISLASGMNPLLVMIQQGDQIRGAIEQAEMDGVDLKNSMNTAAKQIAEGFVNTGKAIGGFFVGAIKSAGTAATDFGLRVLGVSSSVTEWKKSLAAASAEGDLMATTWLRVAPAMIGGLGVTVLGVVAALGALAVAFFKVNSEQNEMARSLALTNGAMGLSMDAAYGYARAMDQTVGTTTKALEVISEMGKTGVLVSSEIGMVTKAAVNLEKYGNVAIEDTVKTFAKLKEDPYDALVKIAKATGMVSLATVQTVYELEKQGKTFEAQQLALQTYADVTEAQTERMRNDYTALGKAVMWTSEMFGELFDSVKNLFRQEDPRKLLVDQLETAQKNKKNSFFDSHKAYWGEVEKGLSKQILMMDEVRSREESEAELKRQRIDLQQKNNKYSEEFAEKDVKYSREINKLTQEYNDAKAVGVSTSGIEMKLREVSLNYAKSLTKENDKAEKAQDRVADKIENKFLATMKKLTGETNASQASAFEMSKAYKLMLDVFDDPVYATYNAEQRVRIAQGLQELYNQEELRVATEARTEAEKNLREVTRKANEEHVKIWKEIDQATFEYLDKQVEILNGLREEAALLEYQNGLVAVSTEERTRLLKIKQAELEYTKEIAKINSTQFSTPEAQEEAFVNAARIYRQKILNVNTEVSQDLASKLQNDVASAIETALFEGGAAGKRKLRDMIVAELREPITLTIKAFVDMIMGKGGSKSVTENFSNAVTKVTDLLSGKTGEKFGGNVTKALEKFGGKIGEYAGTIGKMAGYLGNAMMGYELSKSISGGYSVNKNMDKIGAIASSYFGPIAGVITGAINRLFGRKLKDYGVQGTFGGDTGFSGSTYKFYKGGLFRSDKTKTGDLDSSVESALALQFNNLKASTSAMAEVLGLGSEAIDGFTKSIKFSTKGMTEEQIQARFEEEFSLLNDEMAAIVLGSARTFTETLSESVEMFMMNESGNLEWLRINGTKTVTTDVAATGVDYSKPGETPSQTLARLANSLVSVNAAFSDLGFALKETSLAGADAASTFVDFFGTIDEMNSSLQSYYENYYSEEERVANTTRKLTDALTALGISMPEDRDAFRDIVDDAMASGNEELAAQLIKLSDVFAELNPVLEEVTETMRDLMRDSRELEIELMTLQGRTDEAKAATRALAIEGMTAAEIAIYDYNEGLRDQISAIKKAQDVAEAMSDIQIRLLKAQGKETEALAIERAKERAEMQALDPVLAEMLDTLYAAEDASAAADAAKEVADAWKDTTDSILEEVARIRGLSDVDSVGTSQAKFNAAIAAANAGDIDAANSLPALSQALLEVAGSQAGSLLELRRIEATTAAALEGVAYGIGGESINSTLNSTPAQLQVQQSSATSSASTGAQMIEELKKLRTEVEGLRAEVRSDATHNAKTSKLLERVVRDGETVQVTVVT